MAQKVTGFIKLQIPAGKATPAPPVGPALGQHGVNIMASVQRMTQVLLSLLLSQFTPTEAFHLLQRLRLLPFLSRRLAELKQHQAHPTRQRLPRLLRLRFSRLLKPRCVT